MADPSNLSRPEKERLLRLYLAARGWDEQSARDHVASLSAQDLDDDFAFHYREAEAIKRGSILPPADIAAHYTGRLHGLSLGSAAEQVAIQRTEPDRQGVEVTAPRVIAVVMLAVAAAAIAWGATRTAKETASAR